METKRKALGRGLEELFNSENLELEKIESRIMEGATKDEIVEINLSELRSNPYQPRKIFDEEALKELSDSIKVYGVFQPIIVKKSIKGYDIIAGERRAKASKMAGLTTIPAIVRDFSDEQMMQIALLENLQRENLTAIEEATAYKDIIAALQITQDDLARKLGKSRSHITNILGILKLPKDVQNMVLENKISMGHARSLSKLENDLEIVNLAHEISDKKLSVRETEDIINNKDMPKKTPIKKHEVYTNQYSNIQSVMREKIGTLVKISNNKVVIPFDSDKDLERILDILNIDINY